MIEILENLTNGISYGISITEMALQELFKLKPIKNEQQGYLNAFIFITGIITIFMLITVSFKFIPIFTLLPVISILIFLISLKFNSNHIVHTLSIIFLISIALVWAYPMVTTLKASSLTLIAIAMLITSIYFDLLKKNFVIQLLAFLIFNYILSNTIFKSTLGQTQFLESSIGTNPDPFAIISELRPYAFSQLLISIIMLFIAHLSWKTNRILFSKTIEIISGINILGCLIIFFFGFDSFQKYLIILILPIISLILSIVGRTKWCWTYLITFFLGVLYLLSEIIDFNKTNGQLLTLGMFGILTLLIIIAKKFID